MQIFRRTATAAALAFSVLYSGLANAAEITPAAGAVTTTASGLQISDSKIGGGVMPQPGQTCVVRYIGWLSKDGGKGRKFDSSASHGAPFEFALGQGMVIPGWDEGVATMKVGGKRTLTVPPALAYGDSGAGGVIPPNATLIFEIELVSVKD